MSSATVMGASAAVPPHELFNRKLQEFMEDLSPLLGHLQEYGLIVKYVRLLSHLEPRANTRLFLQHVAEPFSTRIMAKDTAFFMEECDDAFATAINWSQCASQGLVPILKQVWAGLTPQDQEAIWAHLQVLIALCHMVNGGAPRT